MRGIDEANETLAPLDREAQDWVARFVSGEATAADLDALKRWSAHSSAHRQAFVRATRLWEAVGRAPVPAGLSLPLSQTTTVVEPAWIVRPSGRRAALAGALSVAAVGAYAAVRPPLGLWPSLTELAADWRTDTGEQRRVMVSDGIALDMNTQTSVALRANTAQQHGIELIAGEASITTAPGTLAAFTVIAGDGRITAGQARFNVRYDGTSVSVSCLEGQVNIARPGAMVSLPAQRQVHYSPQGFRPVTPVDTEMVTAWQHGLLIFQATPLSEAIDEINRYRRGRIILMNADLGRRLFNARFRIENVDGVVDQIQQIFGARVRTLPGGLVLLS